MIINVAELKRIFKIEFDKDDDILYQLILAQEQAAVVHCGTVLKAQDITEYHNGNGESEILLRNYPVNSIESIHDDTEREFGAASLLEAEDYAFESYGSVFLIDSTFDVGKQNVKVVYNAGYEIVPSDVKLAIANLAFANYIEANGGINAIQGQDFVYKPKKLRDEAFSILDRYRTIR